MLDILDTDQTDLSSNQTPESPPGPWAHNTEHLCVFLHDEQSGQELLGLHVGARMILNKRETKTESFIIRSYNMNGTCFNRKAIRRHIEEPTIEVTSQLESVGLKKKTKETH